MKYVYGLLIVFALVLVIGLATAKPSTNTASKVSWDVISADIKGGSMLIDVRTNEEYSAGHIDGSILLPLSEIQAGKLPEQDKSKPLYLYCRSGNRSAQAAALLRNAGYTNVVDLGAMTNVLGLGAKQI